MSPKLADSAITTLPDARPAFATSGVIPPTAALASSTAATETAKASRLPIPTSSRLAAMERTVSVAAGRAFDSKHRVLISPAMAR